MSVESKQGKALINNVPNMAKVAEIGVWKGHTVRYLLRNTDKIKEYWAIDPWAMFPPGHGRSSNLNMGHWNSMYERLCLDMVWFPTLRVLRLKSEEAAPLFPDKYFDLVFIDAMHDYENVKKDIGLWFPKVKPGGVLAGHDYGNRRQPGVKKAVDEIFTDIKVDTFSTVWMVTV